MNKGKQELNCFPLIIERGKGKVLIHGTVCPIVGRICHQTARCVQHDDIDNIMEHFEWVDIIISVSPSYWADVPGQFKAFIDRCTPWCNTHDPHASLSHGKKGYAVVLRTGPSMKECNRLIESIEHFYGHLEIECCGSLGLCSIEYKEAVESRKSEIIEFCKRI